MAQMYSHVSGDSHLEIDSKSWVPRVPELYRERAPRLVRLPNGGDAWMVEGRPLVQNAGDLYGGKGRDAWRPFGQSYEATAGTGSAEQRIREQDQDGIDAEVLFPGQQAGPRLWRAIGDDDAYRSVVRAYNDFLGEEYCAVDRARLIGMGVIPWTNLKDALSELEHCKQLGLKGVVIGRFPNGRGFPKPEDDQFWSAALDMQMPITVHVEMDRSVERDGKLIEYPRSHPEIGPGRGILDQLTNAKFCRLGGVNAVQLLFAGVFDRFPSLKFFFAENQIGWIPHFLEMADERYERHAGWAQELLGVAPLERSPSEYIREFCYWGFQHDQIGVELRHHLGVDRLIWASDFPHQESDWPESRKVLERNFAGVPADETDRMVARNAVEFFHLD